MGKGSDGRSCRLIGRPPPYDARIFASLKDAERACTELWRETGEKFRMARVSVKQSRHLRHSKAPWKMQTSTDNDE
jgi:hypothetical protein